MTPVLSVDHKAEAYSVGFAVEPDLLVSNGNVMGVLDFRISVFYYAYARADVFDDWKKMIDYSLSTFKLR